MFILLWGGPFIYVGQCIIELRNIGGSTQLPVHALNNALNNI